MGFGGPAISPDARGRALFELNCAPCHGPSGQGGYLGRDARPPPVAGARVAKITHHVREGGTEMPAFSSAVIPDESLQVLATYVHETLASPVEPPRLGPRQLDPFMVGLFVWGALLVLACSLAVLFAEGRN